MAYNDDFIVKNGLVVRATNLANYQSTSTQTGAITTPGGIGIGENAFIGGQLNVASSSTFQVGAQFGDITKILSTAVNTATVVPDGNALQVSGGIYAQNINIAGLGFIKGSQILTQADGFKGGVISEPLLINTTTNSTSTTTGALSTPGGIGIGSDMYIGGTLNVLTNLNVTGDVTGGGSHLLNTILTNNSQGISSKVTYSGYTATIALTNTGVVSITTGSGIVVSTSTGSVTIFNAGILTVTAGNDISVTADNYNGLGQPIGNVIINDASTFQTVASRGNYTDQTISINNNSVGTDPITGNALTVAGSIGAQQLFVTNTSTIAGAIIVTTSTINQYLGGTITQTLRIANTTSSIDTSTGALVVTGGVGIGQDLYIGRSLNVTGNSVFYGGLTVVGSYTTVTVNSTQTVFRDPVLDIGSGINNSALTINDGLDRGLLMHYNTGSSTLFDNHAYVGRQSSTGEFVYLTDVVPGGNEVVPNPFSGNFGNARFGKLTLNSAQASTNNTSGALVVSGGVGVGGAIYAGSVYDNSNRVVTSVNLTSTLVTVGNAGSGIAVLSTVVTGSNVTVNLTNTVIIGLVGSTGISVVGTLAPNGMQVGVSTITNTGVLSVQAQGDMYSTWDGTAYYTGNVRIYNSSTLDTVVARGNSTTSIIQVLNQTTSTTVTSTNALQVLGGISAKTLMITDKAFLNGAEIVTSATINSFSGGTINNKLKIAATDTSTSTTTGALVVTSGIGVGDNINVWNTLTQWNTNTVGLSIAGTAQFKNVVYANTVSALTLGLDLVSVGTGTVNINGIDILNYSANVWFVTSNGKDTNDGRRIASGFKTIKHALAVAQSGDTVYIEAGTYTEVFPLTVPTGVTVKGAGLRATIVQPTVGTNTLDGFLLNGETTISDFTVTGFYKPGYALRYAAGAKVTTKSAYVERFSVITKGSVTSSSDPYGFIQADAGNGVLIDGSALDSTSLEPAMLFNEATFIVPNATGMFMTNGARAELLNGFVYFADKAINAQSGTTGYGGVGKTKIKLANTSGTFNPGDVVTYYSSTGTTLASGTIASVSGSYVYFNGPVWGFETISSRPGKNVTTYGGAVQQNTIVKFGTTAGDFRTSGSYLEVLNDNDFQFGTGDYTFEGWIYLTSIGKVNRIMYKGTTLSSSIRLSVSAGNLLQATHAGTIITGASVISAGQWYHVALSHQGSSNTIKLYLDGNLEASSAAASGNINNTDPLDIGGLAGSPADSLSGYMDDFRVSNSYRYPLAFTPPASAETSDASTILLLHMDAGNGVTGFIDDASGTQDVRSSSGGTAKQIALADYHQFGAELRCIGSAAVFGNQGVIANGTGTDLKLIAFNMSFIGAGGDLTDDASLVVQSNEVIQTNNGHVYYQTVDQSGDFRVGSSFTVNQRTGNVSFGSAQVNLSGLNQLVITDGTHNATIYPTSISVGDLSLAGNTIASLSGDITIDPAGTLTTINSDLQVSGAFSVNTLSVPSLTNSTSTNSGALTVGGGAGIGGNLNIGGTFTSLSSAISTSSIANNAFQAINGGIGAQTLYLAQGGYIGTSAIVTTATIGQSLGGIVPNALHITSTASSTSTQTGALIVDGGVGIGGNLTVGGNLNLLGGGSVLTNITATTDAYIGASVTKNGTTATINIVNLGVQSVTGGTGISVSASTGTVTINSTDTLDLVAQRGGSTTAAIAINNGSVNTATTAGNALSVAGGIGAYELYLKDNGWINGAQIVTTATLGNAFSSSTAVTGNFNITNTSSNAFTVAGGATIGGNLFIGGSISIAGTSTYINSNYTDIGTKVLYLSTLSGSAINSTGAGIIIGKDASQLNAQWAEFLYDGGSPGNWITTAGIQPKFDNTIGLGSATSWFASEYVKALYYDTASSTSTVYSTSTIAGNSLMTAGGIAGRSLYLTTDGWINGSKIITTGNLSTYAGTYDGQTPLHFPLTELDTTDSSSTTTGALIVKGGAGIGYNLYVGHNVNVGTNLTVNGTALIQNTNSSTAYNNGALVVDGGVGILGNLRVAGVVAGGNFFGIDSGGPINTPMTVSAAAYYANMGNVYLQNPTGPNLIQSSGVIAPIVGAGTGELLIQASDGIHIQGVASTSSGAWGVAVSATIGSVYIKGAGIGGTTGTIIDSSLFVTSTATIISLIAGDVMSGSTVIANSTLSSTSTISGNAIQAGNGGIGAQTLYLSNSGWINGAQIITTATLNGFTGGAINNSLIITNQTNAVNTQSGALQVVGGVGVGKDMYIGGSLHLVGDLYVDGTQTIINSNSIQTGDKTIGVSTASVTAFAALGSGITVGPSTGYYAKLTFDGNASWQSSVNLVPGQNGLFLGTATNAWGAFYVNAGVVKNGTSATSTSSGALQVAGGIGAGNLYLGSTFSSTLTNTQNALTTVGGAWIGGQLNVAGTDAWINGSPILTATHGYDVTFLSGTDSSANNNGSLVLTGGLGVGKNINVGGQVFINNISESTITNTSNALVVSGGIYADSAMFNTIATVNGGIVITTATIGNYAFNGGSINKPITINSATQATSTITGAFQIVNGGAGIGGNLWLGQYLNVGGTSTFQSTATFSKGLVATTASITTATITSNVANTATAAGNALNVVGGGSFGYLRVANQAWVNGSPVITAATINSFSGGTINNPLAVSDPTQATSTVTGALRVINGGLGVGGNIWSGGSLNFIDPTFTADGYFGPDTGLTSIQLGSNNTAQPLAFIINKGEVGRFAANKNFGVGTTTPAYGIDLQTGNSPAWSVNTVSNLLSLKSSLWNTIISADIPRLDIVQISNNSGASFENWITAGTTQYGSAQPLVFAGGTFPDVDNLGTNTVTEWARFTSSGNFVAAGGVQSLTGYITSNSFNTATSLGNALQVVGGASVGYLRVATAGWINNSPIITAATINSYQFNGGTITSPLYVNTTTQAVSSVTGAIRTIGGIAAYGNIFAGQNFYGNLIATNITATNINAALNPLTIGGTVTISTTSDTTGPGFGALQISQGGAYIAGTTWINKTASNTGTITGNALQLPNGGIGAQTLYLAQSGWINGSPIVTAATINSFSGGTIASQLNLSNNSPSVSTNSGALTVVGGVGIGGDLYVGGSIHATGDLYVDGTQTFLNSTNIQTGDKVLYLSAGAPNAAAAVSSGIAVGNTTTPFASLLFDGVSAWQSQGNIIPSTAGGWSLGSSTNPWNTEYVLNSRIQSTTDASSTTTGALQTLGGVGIAKNLVVGSSATVQSTLFSLTTITNNAIYTPGGIGAQYLNISGAGYINNSQIITAANIGGYAYNGGYVNNAIIETTTTDATSLTTGSIVTAGGAAIAKQLQVGSSATIASSAYSTSTIANNALQVTGGIGARSIYLTTEGWINGSPIVTAANINNFSGGTINAALTINNGTQAVSTTTGALIVQNGGLGIGGNIYAGGYLNVGSTANASGTIGTTGSGSLQVLGGASVSGILNVSGTTWLGGNVGIQTTTPGQALEVNGNFVVGAYNNSRVQITNGGGANAIYEIATTESNPRWTVGRDLFGIATSGIAFMNANQSMSAGGAGVGALSGSNGYLGFYTTNGTSQVARGAFDTSGNFGIGAVSGLLAKLDVRGNMYVRAGNTDHIFLTNNISQYADIQLTRTGTGSNADWRIGVAGAASNFLPTAAQGDAVMTYNSNLLIGSQSNYEVARFSGSQLLISTATQSISTQSGSIVTYGGVGIQGNLNVGGTANFTGTTVISSAIFNTSTIAGNALQVAGGIGAYSINLQANSWIGGYQIVTTNNIGAFTGAFNGGTISTPLYIANPTDSGSTSSGALYTTGGVGISKQLYVGGTLTAAGNLTISGTTNHINATLASSTTTAAVVITNGGLGVGGNAIFGSTVQAAGLITTNGLAVNTVGTISTDQTTFNIVNSTATTVNIAGAATTMNIGNALGTINTPSIVKINNATQASSTITGALQIVNGGAGIGGNVWIGGTLNTVGSANLQAATVTGVAQFTNATSATSTLTGAVQITGGLGVQGDIYARNIYANGTLVGSGGSGGGGGTSTSTPYINVYTATISFSTLTGGLTTVGGAGIGKDLFVGGPVVVGRAFMDGSASVQAQNNIESGGASVSNGQYSQGGNLLVYSSDYSQANWSKFNGTYQAGSTTSPDGTLNGSKIIETGASGNHYIQQTINQSGPVTVSAYMAAADRTYSILNITVGGTSHAAWFNLSTGAVASTAGVTYPVTARIDPIPYLQGSAVWYRCSVTVWAPQTATATAVGAYTALGGDTSIGGTLSLFSGSAGFGVYCYGIQAEPGYYPGAYVPTTAAAVTPAAHVYSGGSLYVANTATVGGSTVVTQANIMTYWGGTSANSFTLNNATNSTSTTTGALVITNGGIGVGGNIYVGGTLYATAKSFLIDHPTKEGYKLQYGSLEGPENGVYVRGKLTASNTIELPEYWTELVDEDTITVDLTPIGYHQKLFVESIGDNKVVVGNSNLIGAKINCFYVVWAERKDIKKLDVEHKE